MTERRNLKNNFSLKSRLHQVLFEAETTAGKTFNIVLIVCICISIIIVTLDSVESISLHYATGLTIAEWVLTILFTIEFFLRLVVIRKPVSYILSFYGCIDLLAIAPTWLHFIFGGFQSLLILRVFRLLRVFRIFKLAAFLYEATVLQQAIRASFNKIVVFLFAVLAMVLILGSLMYTIEGPEFGFTDIPTSMYWAIVTLTTVGYGDISPHTSIGKLLASAIMLLGYGIIAVPTGIVTVELATISKKTPVSTRSCSACGKEGHESDARHCRYCGSRL